MQYPAYIAKSEKSGEYGIAFPDVDGCVASGNTFDEALINGKAALEFHIEGMAIDGDNIPVAGCIEDYVSLPDYKQAVWALVHVDVNQYLGKAVKLNITLPQYLLTRIDHMVKHSPDYGSRSGFLAETAIKALF
ncbi:type II toxin-antitoxin system HicB family antitoxin [Candidatus Sororendozoicomonas aggregata]|uniref:type II toxin-antitoxin system HicB family antitoxin n=1 Tax=Candidatus Sororendozoicomonas aggregata TaxID=3073239 RepID=UPI002ED0F2B5